MLQSFLSWTFPGHPELKLKGMTQEIGKVTSIQGKIDFSRYPVSSFLYLFLFSVFFPCIESQIGSILTYFCLLIVITLYQIADWGQINFF